MGTTAAHRRRPGSIVVLSPSAVALALLFLSTTLRLAAAVQPYGGGGPCALAVAPLGYPCEEHQVTTADGYILSLQRIPSGGRGGHGGGAGAGASSSRAGQPVLLQHGVLVQDGMSWLLASPEESLPFILADRGFDVWIANNRGTRWSRRHVSLDPSSRLYWNWSWDDLVVNDLPAMVDFVVKQTGQKPHYVGHSMVPSLSHYGGRDSLADPADVRLLLQDLPGHDQDKLTVQYLDKFAHLDFIIGVCAKDYVYKDMIDFLNRFN
ncbi:Triacylglycerol lipase 2 [Zea mays]|uniref:Triacylglycerol lipase 2 n=1 Tax=Zea mays TaxID=4577 RepID=A0A3L6F1X2_MAIZE|nr:Triacylglycerol lipase 2 [Zea mays]